MSEEPSKRLQAFQRLVERQPEGPAFSIELLISQLRPPAADLLRLAAIPHAIDREIAAVLLAGVAPEDVDRAWAEIQRLSCVSAVGPSVSLHDEARRYLLGQWIAAREADAERWRTFREVNARLAACYEGRRGALAGQARDNAERSEIYHRLAAGEPSGFERFREVMDRERLSFRLESCEALLRVVAELDPLFDARERAWLGYYRARILADQRRHEEAAEAFRSLRGDPAAAADIDLAAMILFGLHDAYRRQRSFPAALAALGELVDFLGTRPGTRRRQLEATQAMAALLLDMRETERAEELLEGLIEAPELAEDHSLMARTWNTMGSLHQRMGRPRRAIEAYGQALAVLERAGERFRPMQVHNNIGALHAGRAEWEPARESLERALAIARDAGDLGGEAAALGNLARVYSGLGREGDAVAATERAIELLRTIHDWHSAANLSGSLARGYRRMKDEARARAAFRQAANLYQLAGEVEAARGAEAQALASPARGWGLGRWFALVAGIAAAVFVAMLAVAFAVGFFSEF
jgi:tetratricopeptide (TPR) repeat protein